MAGSNIISVQHRISCCAMAALLQKAIATCSLVHSLETILSTITLASRVFVIAFSYEDRMPHDSTIDRQSVNDSGIDFSLQSGGINSNCCIRRFRAVSFHDMVKFGV